MLPFTFLIFPGQRRARRSTACPGTTSLLFVATVGRVALPDVQRAQGGRARLGVRRRADAGDRRGLRHVGAADGGAAPHRRLEPAAGACCPSRSIRCLPTRAGSGRCAGSQSTVEQATAYHVLSNESLLGIPDPGLRRDRDRLSGVRHRPDDDGRRQVLHQSRLRAVRHVPRRRRQGRHLRQRPARHDVGQRRLQRADRRHHDHPHHEAHRLLAPPTPAPSRPAPRPAPCWRRR